MRASASTLGSSVFFLFFGERYTYGHIFDFYKQLKSNPKKLENLGNGKQRKSYLHVQDCLNAMLLGIKKAKEKVKKFNFGGDSLCEEYDFIGWICKEMGVTPELEKSGGDRGWVGDCLFLGGLKDVLRRWKNRSLFNSLAIIDQNLPAICN